MNTPHAAILLALAFAAPGALGQATSPATPPQAPPTTAPAKDLPPAKVVVEKGLAAVGPAAKIAGIKHVKYTVTAASAGNETKMSLRSSGPRKLLVTADTPNGAIEMGRVDMVAWTNTGTGYTLVPEDRIGQVSQLDLYGLVITLGARMDEYKTVDQAEFNGVDCYKVMLADEPNGKTYGYFDAKAGTIEGLDQTQYTPMGEMSLTTTFSEPKAVGGLTLFTKASMVAGGMPLATLTFSDVEFNPDDDFEITVPAEVQAQIAERKAIATSRPATSPAGATTKPAEDFTDSPMVRQMLANLKKMEDPAQLRMMSSLISGQMGQITDEKERKQMEFLIQKIDERIAELEGGK